MRPIDPSDGRDPVIHGHDHLRATGVRLIDHFRTQAVTIFKTVRHQIRHAFAAQRPQRQYAKRGAGRAVGVKVADHDDTQSFAKRVVEHIDRFLDPRQLLPGQHTFDASLQILRPFHTTAGIEPPQ